MVTVFHLYRRRWLHLHKPTTLGMVRTGYRFLGRDLHQMKSARAHHVGRIRELVWYLGETVVS